MPRLNCIEKFKNSFPELHEHLKSKSGVDYNEGEEGKQAYVQAIKELQENSLDALNDVYSQVGIKGYSKKQPSPTNETKAELPAENVVPSTFESVNDVVNEFVESDVNRFSKFLDENGVPTEERQDRINNHRDNVVANVEARIDQAIDRKKRRIAEDQAYADSYSWLQKKAGNRHYKKALREVELQKEELATLESYKERYDAAKENEANPKQQLQPPVVTPQKASPTNEAKTGAAVILPSEQRDIPTTTIAPKEQPKEQPVRKPSVILPKPVENAPVEAVPEQANVAAQEVAKPTVVSRVVPSVEPAAKKGRTPVTLTGNTEQERQSLIKRRKADTFVPTSVSDEQKLLDRVNKFNNEGLRFKRNTKGRSELNNIKIAVDNYNKTHKQKYSAVQNRTGNIEFKNSKGDKVRTNNKVTGDLSIDDNGIPLVDRSDKVKEVFNELLDRNIFPTGYTVDGRRMSESQLDGAIQDILDGIPSRGATNYLNALEQMIEKNDFDFSTASIPQQEAITLEDITATEKEQVGDLMDEKALEDYLNEQSNLTPEQEQIVSDNIETLIDEYTIIGDTGQIQTPSEEGQAASNTSTEPDKKPENAEAKAAQTSENKFDAKVDKAADALIKFLTPKVKVDAQKSGLGVEEIVRAGAAAIKAAYKIEQNIEKAIATGIAEMKKLWNDSGYEDFPEDGLRGVMEKEFAEPAPKTKPAETKEQKSENEIILSVLSLPVNERAFPTLFQGNESKQQLAADTQGKGQDREVNIEYVEALDKDLREVSIQAAKSLKDQLRANWGEKTLKWLEQNPDRGNLAQVIGVLNVMSTENFQDIQDTHDGNKLNKLKRLQNRIDVVAATRAREASLGLRQRSMYVKFGKGGNMREVLDNAILTNEMIDLQEQMATVLSEEVTDDEINKVSPIRTTPQKKQSLIRRVTGTAKKQSSSSLKDDLKNKAADISNRTKKTFKEIIADANEKIKNIKC